MGERGNNFLVFIFILVLFALFLLLKGGGFLEITGHAVSDSEFKVKNVSLTKVEILTKDSFRVLDTLKEFYKYDNLGCIVQYSGNASKLDVGFYSPNKNIDTSDKIYLDILNDNLDNTVCKNGICLAYYNVTDYVLGDWNCFSKTNETKVSNKLEMKNKPPTFTGVIPQTSLTVSGEYSENGSKINLKQYFSDLEGDKLTYGAVGQLYIEVSINENGLVSFANPNKYEGNELILFRAHDGISGTFSNNVVVKVGSGVARDCIPVWDCTWGTCVNGKKTCTYSDKNNCEYDDQKPVNLVESCSTNPIGTKTENKIMTGDLESFSVEMGSVDDGKRGLLFIGLIVLILAVLGGGGYFIFTMKKKPKVVAQSSQQNNIQQTNQTVAQPTTQTPKVEQTQNVTNLKDLQNYLVTQIKNGSNEQKLSEDLVKAGWNKKDIDSSFNYAKLKIFVDSKLAAGFSKEKIIESLKTKGWKDDLINSLF